MRQKGYYGLKVHEAVLNYGVKVTGATVHFVNEVPDGGAIIFQKAVDIRPDDTPETLQRRVMEQAEWQLLPGRWRFLRGEDPGGRPTGLLGRIKGGKTMTIRSLKEELGATSYPGRGIILGQSTDGKKAVIAYFIMGRSENSRNRVFVADGDGIKTKAFDESKMVDPSLIIYAPVRKAGPSVTIVTNGDQTDTVTEYMKQGKTFEEALRTRELSRTPPILLPGSPEPCTGISHTVRLPIRFPC